MIVFPFMLEAAAKRAGMKVPKDCDNFNPEEFPHFQVFCNTQLARKMVMGEHWENAKIIASFSDDEIKTITWNDLMARGFSRPT